MFLYCPELVWSRFPDDFKGEGDGMAGAASGDYASAGDGRPGFEMRTRRREIVVEAIETGGLVPLDALQLGKDKAGGGADGCNGSACVVMRLHQFYEGFAAGEVHAAGHASRENEDVILGGPFVVRFKEGEAIVDAYRDSVRGGYEGFVAYAYEGAAQAGAPQDVVGGEGFDVFETVGKENIYAFHREMSIFVLVKVGN